MNNTYKIHFIYWILILLLIIIFNYKSFYVLILDLDKNGYLKLNADVELFNPNTGELVGYLKEGIILKYPNIDDLDDCDLGDNDRYKIYADLIGIEAKYRTYIDISKEGYDRNSVYDKLNIKLRKATPSKNRSDQE